MTRIPMIAVEATSLLLLLLLITATPASSRATKPTTVAAPTSEANEEATSPSGFDVNTVTIEIDSDIILTTEDGLQAFTYFPDVGQTTTEEPLPKSVLLQLERERQELEQQNDINSTSAIIEDPHSSDSLKPQLKTTPKPTTKSAAIVGSTTAKIPITTTESAATKSIGNQNIQTYFGQNVNLNDNQEDLAMQAGQLDVYIESTSILPQVLNEDRNVMFASETKRNPTSLPPFEEDHNTSGGPTIDVESNTDTTDSAEFTTTTVENLETTLSSEVATESNTEMPVDSLHLMNTRNVYEISTMKPEALTTTTAELLQPEMTTVNTTESESSTTGTFEEVTETTIASPKLQEVQFIEETTNSPDLISSSTASGTTTITTTPTTTTTTTTASTITSTDIPTTTTTIPTPTTPTPTTTTTPLPTTTQPTRMARIERIFNPDGVEVLYGYSSVVRTHHS